MPLVRRALALERHGSAPSPGAGRIDSVRVEPHWRVSAASHAVLPTIAASAERLGLDAGDRAWLVEARADHAYAALEKAGSSVYAYRALRESGVRALLLKGVALALRTTGRLDARMYDDIDILIEPSDLATAEKSLVSAGFTPEGHRSSAVSGAHRHWAGVVGHDLSYGHRLRPPVDLHWRLTRSGILPLEFDELWQHRRSFRVGGLDIEAVGDVHELLHVAVHGAVHGFHRLGWVVDAARMIRVLPEAGRECAIHRARTLGVVRPLALAARMASALEPHGMHVRLNAWDRRVVDRLVAATWRDMPPVSQFAGDWPRFLRRLALRPDLYYKACTVAEAAAPLRLLEDGEPGRALPFPAAVTRAGLRRFTRSDSPRSDVTVDRDGP